MNLVDEIHLAVALSKLVFGVNEDKALLLGDFLSTGKELAGLVFHDGIILSTDDALCNDFLF